MTWYQSTHNNTAQRETQGAQMNINSFLSGDFIFSAKILHAWPQISPSLYLTDLTCIAPWFITVQWDNVWCRCNYTYIYIILHILLVSRHGPTEEWVWLVWLAEVPDVEWVVAGPEESSSLQAQVHHQLLHRHHPQPHQLSRHTESLAFSICM